MKTRILCFLIGCIFASGHLIAQPTLIWEYNYGGTYDSEELNHILPLPGGYLLSGMSNSCNSDFNYCYGNEDAILIETDMGGDTVRVVRYGDFEAEAFLQTVKDATGNFYSVGFSSGAGGMIANGYGLKDVWIVKTDPTGAIIWEKTYGGNRDESAYSVVIAPDGSLIVACVSYSTGLYVNDHSPGINRDIWLLRLDAATGNIIWKKCYGDTGDEGGDVSADQTSRKSVALCSGGDSTFIIAAYSNSASVAGDIWVFRIDINGNLIDENFLGGSLTDIAHSIIPVSWGGFLITGASRSVDGDVSNHHGSGNLYDGWLVKINDSLDKEWDVSIGGTAYDVCYDAIEKNQGFYVVGLSESEDGDCQNTNHGGWDIMLNYITISGQTVMTKNYGSSLDDEARTIAIGNTGHMVFGGTVKAANFDVSEIYGLTDWWLVRFMDVNGVNEHGFDTHAVSLFPNPAKNNLQLQIENFDSKNNYALEFYDLSGRMIYESEFYSSTFQMDVSDWVSGFYTCKIRDDDGLFWIGRAVIQK